MDNATLVSVDVEKGKEVLDALEASGMRISVALWVRLSEYYEWQLALSSPQFPPEGLRKAYESVLAILEKSFGKTFAWRPPLLSVQNVRSVHPRLAPPLCQDQDGRRHAPWWPGVRRPLHRGGLRLPHYVTPVESSWLLILRRKKNELSRR